MLMLDYYKVSELWLNLFHIESFCRYRSAITSCVKDFISNEPTLSFLLYTSRYPASQNVNQVNDINSVLDEGQLKALLLDFVDICNPPVISGVCDFCCNIFLAFPENVAQFFHQCHLGIQLVRYESFGLVCFVLLVL